MSSETRDYLRRYSKVVADLREYTIVADNKNGSYIGETIDTQTKRELDSRPGATWKIGQRVVAEDVSASQNVIGANPIIVGPSPKDQRGTSATTPSAVTTSFARAFVASVDPDPLVLEIGGEAAQQIISGSGLTEAGEYIASGRVGDDPVVDDADAPIITSAKVTRNISADAASPLGTFDLQIDGVRVRDALKIIEPSSAEVLYVLGYSGTLFALNPKTLAVIQTFATGEWGGGAIGRMRANVAVATLDGLAVCDPATGDVTLVPVTWPPSWGPPYFFASYALECFFRSRESGDTYIDSIIADGSLTQTLVSGTDPVAETQLVANGSTIWSGDVNNRILKFDAETLASSFVAMPLPTDRVAVHAGSLYVASRDDSRTIYRRNLTTGAAISDIAITIAGTGNFAQIASAGGKLFACASNSTFTATLVFVFGDGFTTPSLVATIAGLVGQMVGDSSAVFLPDVNAGKVWRIAASNYAVTSSSVLDVEGVDTAFVYSL